MLINPSIGTDEAAALSGRTAVFLLPCLNDWDSLFSLLPQIDAMLTSLTMKGHIIIIDDGSTIDKTEAHLASFNFSAIRQIDELVLTRNQGHQRAIAIGIGYAAENVNGDFLIVMDCDHEDKPIHLPAMMSECVAKSQNGIVFAERTHRSEGRMFRIMYWCYQRVYRLFAGSTISFGHFCVIPWRLVGRVSHVSELWTHFPAAIMRSRLSFSTVPSERGIRMHGESRMRFSTLLDHAFGSFLVFADSLAARTMIMAAIASAGISLCAVGLLISHYFIESPPITRWTWLALALLVILLVQVAAAAVNLMFLAAISRSQTLLVPAHIFDRFIAEKHCLMD